MEKKTIDGAMFLSRQKRRGSDAQVEDLALERETDVLFIVAEGVQLQVSQKILC